MNKVYKYLVIVVVVLFSNYSFSQRLFISKKSNKEVIKVKVILPKGYKLNFIKGNKVVKSVEYIGEKFFEIKNSNVELFSFYDDKFNKTFILILDDKEDLKSKNIVIKNIDNLDSI
jgi:hypothetical protein